MLRPAGIFGCVEAVESIGAGPVVLRAGTGKDGPVLTESGGVLADLLVPGDVVVTEELDRRRSGPWPASWTPGTSPTERRKRQFVEG